MSDAAVPRIKVTASQALDGSGSPAVGIDLPATDGGQAVEPRSTTSSEGNSQSASKKPPSKISRNISTGGGPLSPPLRESTAIDPLSHHILKRTNTENTIPQKLRHAATSDSPNTDLARPISPENGLAGRQLTPEIVRQDSNAGKEKKSFVNHTSAYSRVNLAMGFVEPAADEFNDRKGVSFLSRFSIIGGKKKDQPVDVDDDESEIGDQFRTEGMNAHVFASSIGANGYIPQHKEPPRYIKVRAHNKRTREFNRMFLAQELCGTKHQSNDEKVPGITTTETHPPNSHKLSKLPKGGGAVWATEFSKDGRYLAAAGRDQIVRVWAVISTPEERRAHERDEELSSRNFGGERLSAPVFRSKPVREFEGHTGDILDLSWSKNNFLLSSSMDKTVRLWHISRQECLCTFKHKDFVTSIAFHPRDDRFFLAGSLDSILRLWAIPDKTVAFWNTLPDLITAVAFTPDGKTAIAGVLNGLCLFYETEGLKYHTQIHVRSSRGKNARGSKITGIRTATCPPNDPDGEVKILITSNDSRVRMYNLRDKSLEMKFRGHENSCSQINASFSDNVKYVICGSEDRKAYIWSTGPAETENKDKRPVEYFEAHSDMVTAAVMAPAASRQLLSASGDPIYDLCNPPPVTLLSREESIASSVTQFPAGSEKRHSDPVSEPLTKRTEESPAYIARSAHPSGNIIITADHVGGIKVFRQDCAHQKRRNDSWETGSTFSKKMLGRSNSIMTRNSGGSHSRRNSVSQSSLPGLNMPPDQILSWRNEVNTRNGANSISSERSVSPGKFSRSSYQPQSSSQNNLASTARQQAYAGTPLMQASSSVSATSPAQSVHRAPSNSVSLPPTPGFSIQRTDIDDHGLRLDPMAKSYQFWNKSTWKDIAMQPQDPSKLAADAARPGMDRNASVVSKLSSDDTSVELDDDSDGEALACKKCGGRDFRARRLAGKGQKLVCTKCGMTAE